MVKLGAAYINLRTTTGYAVVIHGDEGTTTVAVYDNQKNAEAYADSLFESLQKVSGDSIKVEIQETSITLMDGGNSATTTSPNIVINPTPNTTLRPKLWTTLRPKLRPNFGWTSSTNSGTI